MNMKMRTTYETIAPTVSPKIKDVLSVARLLLKPTEGEAILTRGTGGGVCEVLLQSKPV